MSKPPVKAGGQGGDASVSGDNSNATGGDGGEAVIGDGGKGGDARVVGNRSSAKGGLGGRGGVGPGMPGQDAVVVGDDCHAIGGQGGEAPQLDGRGGRGGRSGDDAIFLEIFGLSRRPHMKHPYGEPVLEPGRGGDSLDTPQYKARRLIVEDIKAQYFRSKGLSVDEAWWDRDIVPLAWINERLVADGHRWQATVVDLEYQFDPA